jgi:predicted GIY-YIG superfamily endonuclease
MQLGIRSLTFDSGAKPMHEAFREYVEALHPSFERLQAMEPVKIPNLPKDAPLQCIYLFSEGPNHLYVGRTRNLWQRLRQHSIPGYQHNQAVFTFRLARESTGSLIAAYTASGSRAALCAQDEFGDAFTRAKERVRRMDVRYVEETDPLRQALLEIYVSIVLKSPYNDFDTH